MLDHNGVQIEEVGTSCGTTCVWIFKTAKPYFHNYNLWFQSCWCQFFGQRGVPSNMYTDSGHLEFWQIAWLLN